MIWLKIMGFISKLFIRYWAAGYFWEKQKAMSKKVVFLVAALLSYEAIIARQVMPARAMQVLERMETAMRQRSLFSFHARMRYVAADLDDSVTLAEATVWLNCKPSDSFWGYYFHINGRNKNGLHDYYYDAGGVTEILHKEKEILLFDIKKFDDGDNHPARARSSARVTRTLWFQSQPLEYLTTKNPYYKMPLVQIDSTGKYWQFTFNYPANESGARSQLLMQVDKMSYLPLSTNRTTWWNGTVHREQWQFDQFNEDKEYVQNGMLLHDSHQGYSVKEYERRRAKAVTAVANKWIGKPAPDFSYPDMDGKLVSLQDLRGKYVLLDFWELWCGACILAIPEMKQKAEKYRSAGVELLGVTSENEAGIRRIVKANQLNYRNLLADEKMIKNYGVDGRPSYILIGPDGKILAYDDKSAIEQILTGLPAGQR
jgi:peroxiredoxin